MISKRKIIKIRLLAIAIGIAGFVGFYFCYILLGLGTGVIAMCATAPEWWCHTYLYSLYGTPLFAGWIGYYCGRRFLHRYEPAA